MRLKGIKTKIKLFFYLIFLIGFGCFLILPTFQPIRSEIVLMGKNITKGIQNLKESTLQKTQWQLKDGIVIGGNHTSSAQWRNDLNIKKGQSMASLDLNQIRDYFMQLPWVKSVVVSRHLSGVLKIYIMEKTPIALWQNQGQYRPLDENGQPIEDPTFSSNELILVVGPDAPEHTLALLKALQQVPQISEQIKSAVRIEGRRWNLYTQNDVKILLPQSEMLQALIRLNRQNEKQDLLKKDVSTIDMRVNGKIKLTRFSKTKEVQKKGKK